MTEIRIRTTVDDSAARAALKRLGDSLDDFGDEMPRIGQVIARRIKRNFRDAKSLYTPLADKTVAQRARRIRRGERLAPGGNLEKPLTAFTGALGEAAAATDAGTPGSAYEEGKLHVAVGVDPERVIYARTVLLGRKIGRGEVPARPAVSIGEPQITESVGIVRRGVAARIVSTTSGTGGR